MWSPLVLNWFIHHINCRYRYRYIYIYIYHKPQLLKLLASTERASELGDHIKYHTFYLSKHVPGEALEFAHNVNHDVNHAFPLGAVCHLETSC